VNAAEPVRRSGRRPGDSGTREAIIRAAHDAFGRRGYRAATIREIARSAQVDPALVHHFFGSKEELFAETIRLAFEPRREVLPIVFAEATSSLGETLIRLVLMLWDRPETRGPFLAVMRSATSEEVAAAALRRFVTREVLGPIAERVGLPDAPLRASLAGSQVIGLLMARYVVKIEPLASADTETIVRWVAPTIQRYLTGQP
jgi:AcrR family transcriptional regulator